VPVNVAVIDLRFERNFIECDIWKSLVIQSAKLLEDALYVVPVKYSRGRQVVLTIVDGEGHEMTVEKRTPGHGMRKSV
jgi:hypothetical protein